VSWRRHHHHHHRLRLHVKNISKTHFRRLLLSDERRITTMMNERQNIISVIFWKENSVAK
jgi:hypothetical protein